MTTTIHHDAPDLTMYHAIHDAMRRSNESLVRAIGATAAGDERRITALAHWFDGYWGELRNHHHNEDDIVFPALAERTDELAEFAGRLADDHHRLDEVLAELGATLSRWALAASACELQAKALDLAVELHDLLDTHLDIEDREVLPMVTRHITAAEYAEIDKRIVKELDRRQALFTVPWFMATVDRETAAKALADAPLMLKVLHRVTRRKYAKLWHEAFCTCV